MENALKLLSQYPHAKINLLSSVTQKHFVETVILSSSGSPRKRLYLACVVSVEMKTVYRSRKLSYVHYVHSIDQESKDQKVNCKRALHKTYNFKTIICFKSANLCISVLKVATSKYQHVRL